jgi:hypothetical protein
MTSKLVPAVLALSLFTVSSCGIDSTEIASARQSQELKDKGPQSAKYDADGNGFADVGVVVNGHYTSVYAWDANGDYYWDLGDGRVMGTVAGIAALDATTLTTCDYVINYRGTFENDPFLNTGWIQNHINCSGFADNNHYNDLIVHATDPRYTGDPTRAVWGDWELKGSTVSHQGNIANPHHHLE